MKTIRGFLFTLFICITVCDGAAQKMDSVMIDRIMVKIDSLESKIEGIKNNTDGPEFMEINLDWYNVVFAFFALVAGIWCAFVDTQGYRQSKRTADNVIRVSPEIQDKQFGDLIRHLYRNLVCTVAMGRKLMADNEHVVYPSEEHLNKLKLMPEDVIHLDIYNHDAQMYNAMHEMKLLMRNYDMEIDIALIHLKNKDIGMDVIVNDLDTLFFKPLYLISRIMEVSLLMYHPEFDTELEKCYRELEKVNLSENRKKVLDDRIKSLNVLKNNERKVLLEKTVRFLMAEHIKKVKEDKTDNPMKHFFDIHNEVRKNENRNSEKVDFPYDGLRRSADMLMKFYDKDIETVSVNRLVDRNILANYNNRMRMFSDCLKARNENENIISSDTVRKILEQYGTVYDENKKRIEKEENINIEYNFREVFLFLLSIDVAMEYEKIHVIRMANI